MRIFSHGFVETVQDFLWFAARKLRKTTGGGTKSEIYKSNREFLKALANIDADPIFVENIVGGVLTWKKQVRGNINPCSCTHRTLARVETFIARREGILLLVILTGSVLVKEILFGYFCPMRAVYWFQKGCILKIIDKINPTILCVRVQHRVIFTKKRNQLQLKLHYACQQLR